MDYQTHLIMPIENKTIVETIKTLEFIHREILQNVKDQFLKIDLSNDWGIKIKRFEIDLPDISGVGKKKEKFVEIINILATTERTISALKWFNQEYPDCRVQQCHPSTSDFPGDDILPSLKTGVSHNASGIERGFDAIIQ